MSAQISQLDLDDSNGTDPEYFVQIRVPVGETPSGSIEFYDSSNANNSTWDSSYSIDLDTAAPTATIPVGDYVYYTYEISGDLLQGNPQNFAVVTVDELGNPQSALLFGKNSDPGDVSFNGGVLDGMTVDDVITSGVVEGDAFQSGSGPFLVTSGGAVVTGPTDPDAQCFAAGTWIGTPGGERRVEELAVGDLVRTADGRDVKVLWVGVHSCHKLFANPRERFEPVRIRSGALGNGTPHSDLTVTADHAMVLDGYAINASALVNGTSIAFIPVRQLPETVTYYHVETANHEVILANGASAESYIDYLERRTFDNYAEYVALYGEDRRIVEMPMPRISAARQVPPHIRARLASRQVA